MVDIHPIINHRDLILWDIIPSDHVLFDPVRDRNEPGSPLPSIGAVLDPATHPLFGADHPAQKFDRPPQRTIIGFKASPKPGPMDPSMGLKDIRPEGVPHPEGKIIISLFNLMSRFF
jgi:hypothetical protein